MNHADISKQNVIDRYLLHQLNEQELEAFIDHLFVCEACKIELFTREKMIQALGTNKELTDHSPQNEPNHSLKKTSTFFNQNRARIFLRLAAVFLVILTGGYLVFMFQSHWNKKKVYQAQSHTPEIREQDNPEKQSFAKETDRLMQKYEEHMEEPVQPNAHVSNQRSEHSERWEPNQELEHILRHPVRSGDHIDILLTQPPPNSNFRIQEGKITVSFKGWIETSNSIDSDFIIKIFSNDPIAYQNDEPLSATVISPKSQVSKTPLNFEKTLSIRPGLYYLVVEKKPSSDPLFIRRIFIDRPSDLDIDKQ